MPSVMFRVLVKEVLATKALAKKILVKQVLVKKDRVKEIMAKLVGALVHVLVNSWVVHKFSRPVSVIFKSFLYCLFIVFPNSDTV